MTTIVSFADDSRERMRYFQGRANDLQKRNQNSIPEPEQHTGTRTGNQNQNSIPEPEQGTRIGNGNCAQKVHEIPEKTQKFLENSLRKARRRHCQKSKACYNVCGEDDERESQSGFPNSRY